MAKEKNKSFVQMKGKSKTNENIIDPLKQYEYIEPKKKINIKKIILIISCVFILILIIILFKITDNYNENNENTVIDNSVTTTTKTAITTPSTTVTTTTIQQTQNNTEYDKLICKLSDIEESMNIETQIVINFENGQLRSDEKTMHISLLNENNKEIFDKYTETLELFGKYLDSDKIYQVETEKKDNEYTFNVITTYEENYENDTTLSYNQSYDSVKNQMEELNYICN